MVASTQIDGINVTIQHSPPERRHDRVAGGVNFDLRKMLRPRICPAYGSWASAWVAISEVNVAVPQTVYRIRKT